LIDLANYPARDRIVGHAFCQAILARMKLTVLEAGVEEQILSQRLVHSARVDVGPKRILISNGQA
jgi:hypothetical protein